MKMISVLAIAGLFCLSPIHAQTEAWTSVGFEYGKFFENINEDGERLESTMISPGFTYSEYRFFNNASSGTFSHASFLFPKSGSSFDGTEMVAADYSEFDLMIQLGLIAGPGFRLRFNNIFNIYYGLGLSFLQSLAMYEGNYSTTSYNVLLLGYNFGAGGNIGFKFNITESLYLDIGITGSYDFIYLVYSSFISSVSTESDIAFDVSLDGDHTMISAKPYVMIGFNTQK